MIIDSHFHPLSLAKRGMMPHFEDIYGIAVATEPGDTAKMTEMLPDTRNIFISTGSGPWVLDGDDFSGVNDEIERLRKEAELFSSDAIGECGIDNHWKYGSPEKQMELFMAEATLASSLGLPLIIHSRDADREMRAALSSSDFKASAVMHCFSSDDEMARFVLDRGLYVSFAGNVTYKGNECIRRAAMVVPDDRILVETDAPYLAPVPFRGKPCLPEYTETTLTFLASLRHQDVQELKEKVRNNLASFMKRDESVRKLRTAIED